MRTNVIHWHCGARLPGAHYAMPCQHASWLEGLADMVVGLSVRPIVCFNFQVCDTVYGMQPWRRPEHQLLLDRPVQRHGSVLSVLQGLGRGELRIGSLAVLTT